MGLSVWRETSKKLTVYRVCYTPIETLLGEGEGVGVGVGVGVVCGCVWGRGRGGVGVGGGYS